MYLATNVEIVFPENRGRKAIKFKSVSSFKIESSWANLTDTAEIVVAKKLYFDTQGKVFELIKTGDPIEIRGGYNGIFYDEFKGFVSEILDDMPVMIKCEDNMYVLKRTSVNKSYSSVSLKNLLTDIVPKQFIVDAIDVNIGKWLFKDATVAQVLQELKDKMNLYCYFKGNVLIGGKVHESNPENTTVNFETTKNIIRNNLKYRKKEDVKIKVKMYSSNVTSTESVEVGEDDGEVQKLYCSQNTKLGMTKIAQLTYDKLKIDGYKGTLTGFGIPFVKHGFDAKIINKEYPEKEGKYYVDAVTTTFSNQGAYRREITLGKKAAY